MKITYVADFMNHHLFFLCNSMHEKLGNNFIFIETKSRNYKNDICSYKKGYAFYMASSYESKKYEWIMQAFDNQEMKIKCQKLIDESDVVIIANTSDEWVYNRLKAQKLTFRAHERWYKKRLPWYRYPKSVVGGWLHHGRFKNLYMLSTSAYTTYDANKIGCFNGKCFRWGYFPEFRTYSEKQILSLKNNDIPQILWSGRLIDWKHADHALMACAQLKREGYKFKLYIAGNGEEENYLIKLCKELDIDCVTEFLGMLNTNSLRNIMEKCNVYLLTSDFQEGWGVVLNEAMNSGCAVIASHAAGATPYLVKHLENGMIYSSGNLEELKNALRYMLDNPRKQVRFGLAAYNTIRNQWNAEEAANRFIELCKGLLGKKYEEMIDKGPCSVAPILKNNWFEDENRFGGI